MTELIKQKKQVPERLYSNKKLAALLIPLALDQLLNSFMGTIDTLVVSNLGSAAISAVSLVDSINILIVQAFLRSLPAEQLSAHIILDVKVKIMRRKRQGSLYL